MLIVESDPEIARQLVCALASARGGLPSQGGPAESPSAQDVAGCQVVQSLALLHRVDLQQFGAALVASVMH